jgi:cell fate regulator YaaT (PSP1 superfamily)
MKLETMKKVVGVRFKKTGKVYYFDPGDMELEVNEQVVVETERGLELGRVVIAPRQVIASELAEPLKPVLRKASPEDLEHWEEVKRREEEVLSKCKELVTRLELPMKLLGAEGNLSGTRFTVYFSAEGRVDFRELVRELAATFKTRIELRQVGARDEVKMIGGFGRCGRPLCCATFLTEFAPVSIKMAKEQGLSLNPMKISGICGRLLCCLGYESELYHQLREKLPAVGKRISTPLGTAKVIEVNPLKETVIVQLENASIAEFTLADLTPPPEADKPGGQPS